MSAVSPDRYGPLAVMRTEAGRPYRLSVVFGTGFTFLLFYGIARIETLRTLPTRMDFGTVKAVALPLEPPPPPPVRATDPEPSLSVPLRFDAERTSSPVKIAVVPPDLDAMLPPPPPAPPAFIQVGVLYTDLRPQIELRRWDDRVYQPSEVDKIPEVLNRVVPNIPSQITYYVTSLSVSLLMTIDRDGSIHNVHLVASSGNREYDEIWLKGICEWTFSPAIKEGKRVKCMVEQTVKMDWRGGSPFER